MGEGREIVRRRRRLGWTQAKLAHESRMSIDTIVRIEGDKNVKVSTWRDVLSALDVGERDLPRHGLPESSLLSEGRFLHANSRAAWASVKADLQGILSSLVQVIAKLETLGALPDDRAPTPADRGNDPSRDRGRRPPKS